MARWLYTVLLALVAPVFWLALARRARREGGSWQVLHRQRFGWGWRCQLPAAPIWIHAVSLGETRAVEPLIDTLLAEGVPILLTHTTATARRAAAQRFAAAVAQGRLQQAWLPYDFPGAMRRFIQASGASQLLLVERELWPNLLAECQRAHLPVALINARLSARSAAQMRRWQRWLRPGLASLQAVLAQTAADGERLAALGAPTACVTGNLKFDVTPDPVAQRDGAAWRQAWQRPVVMLASSRDGEEAMFATAWARGASTALRPARMLVVPRHAARFGEVAELLARTDPGWQRRSAWPDPARVPAACQWLLGDSMGEMARYYGAADIVMLGGSFADFGGQNLLEACAAGVPVIVGPSCRNFAQAVTDAVAAGAAVQVADAEAALALAAHWLAEPAERARRAAAARAFVGRHRGATAAVVEFCRRTRRASADTECAIAAAPDHPGSCG